MIKILKGVALVGMLWMAFAAGAQAYLHQVFVLNEGWSEWQTGEVLVQPTLGVYDPALNVYDTVASIEGAGFISDAILADGVLYVAADGQLLKYDADSYELLASAEVTVHSTTSLYENTSVNVSDTSAFGTPPIVQA